MKTELSCRFCLKVHKKMFGLFSESFKFLPEIERFMEFKITEESFMPSLVCANCVAVVTVLVNFKNKCLNSEKYLRQNQVKGLVTEETKVDHENLIKPKKIESRETENKVLKTNAMKIEYYCENLPVTERPKIRRTYGKKKVEETKTPIKKKRKYRDLNEIDNIIEILSKDNVLKTQSNPIIKENESQCVTEKDCEENSPNTSKIDQNTFSSKYYQYVCKICNETFTFKKAYLIHKAFHLKPKLKCSLCRKFKKSYKNHLKSHQIQVQLVSKK